VEENKIRITKVMDIINKNLVLQYLSMALPYDVRVDRLGVTKKVLSVKPSSEACIEVDNGDYTSSFYTLDEVKPIVRSMRSLTEDESGELSNIIKEWYDKELFILTEEPIIEYALSRVNYSINPMLFNWFLKKHFDFMGLAEIDLAVEVAEDNNPY
jgi:hypothetical protein